MQCTANSLKQALQMVLLDSTTAGEVGECRSHAGIAIAGEVVGRPPTSLRGAMPLLLLQ